MRVLVTGSEGLVGREICGVLKSNDHVAIEFDIVNSQNVLDFSSLKGAMHACDAVMHCAALLGLPDQKAADIVEVNLQGTWNVLSTARECGIHNVVFLSSIDVLGVFKGERAPDFLPLDESHPCYPTTPYAKSKYLAERLCEKYAASHDMDIVCLRPPGVWEAPATYQWILEERRKRTSFEWDPYWEYGAFIDVRDLARACLAALDKTGCGFRSLHVASNDITTSGETSRALVARLHPNVEWRGGDEYRKQPYETLLRNDLACQFLSWAPEHAWADFIG